MRIAVGGFSHETNSFSNIPVTMDVLEKNTWEGSSFTEYFTGVESYEGGLIDEARELGVELVPTRMSVLYPSGASTREVFETSRDRLVELLAEAYEKQPYDGIALVLHGAAVADGYPDPEGEILVAIRQRLGREIPIGITLDLHGNITETMTDNADIVIGIKCYPHVDEYAMGRRLMRLMHDSIRDKETLYTAKVSLPWLLAPALGVTTAGPAHDVQQFCLRREEEDSELVQATFFQGFPYADVPFAGVNVVTLAKTQEAADRNARLIADFAWERRESFKVPLYSAAEAVDLALTYAEGPVIIHESSDNPGGGAPGDGTHLLRELIRRDVPSAFGHIFDAEVAKQAAAAGVGATIHCRLGGKADTLHGEPLELDAYVKCICDGVFIRKTPLSKGGIKDLGLTAHLVVGNVHIVVGSDRSQTFDDGPFMVSGVDWTVTPVLALKSSQHFKGWWADKVAGIICCDSPGIQCSNLALLPFRYTNRGYYPLGE